MRTRLLAHASTAAVVLAAIAIGAAGLSPPAVVPLGGDPAEFSAERAFAHVTAIARDPRPIGSPGNAAARRYLVERVRALGLEPVLQAITVPDYYGSQREVAVVNVMARIAGTDPSGAIALIAHYDTVPGTSGANDNASAVAAVLETGRALLAGTRMRNDVILLFTDGEEPAPRYGSTAFVEQHPYGRDTRLVINLEAIGNHGVSRLVEVAGDERALMARYAAVVRRPAASSVTDDLVELIGGSNTDFAPFRERGVPGFEFAYLNGSPIYHTRWDNRVHHGSLQHHGSQALALARSLGEADLRALAGEDQAVFFTVAGRFVCSYPAAIGILVALAAGLLLGIAVWRDRRAGRLRARRIIAGAAWLLLLAFAMAVVAGLAGRVAAHLAEMTTMGPQEVGVGWLVAIVMATVLATAWSRRRLAARIGPTETAYSATALWWLLAMTASLWMPGAGYVFVWPALASTLVSICRPRAWWTRFAAFSLLAATALLLAVPVMELFHQLAQPHPGNPGSQLPEVMAVVGLLASLLTALLLPHAGAERLRPRVGGVVPHMPAERAEP